jgi:chorismate synthase
MLKKYGITAKSGGGRASARETVGRVAAGAIALQVIRQIIPDLDIVAWVQSVKDVCATSIPESSVSRQEVDQSDVRCPDPNAAQLMTELINKVKANGDSVGGVIRCVMRGVPPGLGEPVFDKLEADLAKAMMSLPATKGFEVGSGFKSTLMLGSEHNDPLQVQEGKICSTSNHAGGINGGISNGEIITINIAFKPVSTIFRPQQTVDRRGNNITFTPESGRHDPCVLPRAVPMVEAMAALVIADHVLRWRATGAFIKPSF